MIAFQAGVLWPDLTAGIPWVIWVVVALSALSVVIDAASRSAARAAWRCR